MTSTPTLRTWGSLAAAALVATTLVGLPASATAAAPPQGALVAGAPAATSVGLTDDAVYVGTSAGVLTHARTGAAADWASVTIDGAPLVGDLLAAEADVLLVDVGDHDALAWRTDGGTWAARDVPDGTTLGRGGAYAVLPPETAGTGRAAWRIEATRSDAVVWAYDAPIGTSVTVDGHDLWAIGTNPSRALQLDILTHEVRSEPATGSAVTSLAPRGRWAVVAGTGYPNRFVLDLESVYLSWGLPIPMDRTTFSLGRDVAVGVLGSASTFVVAELAGQRDTTSYGPASSVRPDVDDTGTTAVYVDTAGQARLVDLGGAPAGATTIVDHAAPIVPPVVVAAATSAATTVVGQASTEPDQGTTPFRPSGVVVTELRYRQARSGVDAPWTAPLAGVTRSVRAVDGTTTCFAARARDAAGNTSAWSSPACTRSDLSAPRLTRVTVPAAAVVTHGHATAAVTYAATDPTGVRNYDVRYKVRPRGAAAYGAWTYRAAFQATAQTRAAVTISSGQRICFSVRARDGYGHTGAWSASHCLGTDVAVPKVMRVSVPQWRAVPGSGKVRSTVTFAATDDRGVTSYDVRARVATSTGPLGSWKTLASHTTHRSVSQTLRAGTEACYEVRARDAMGRVSGWSKPHCTYVAASATAHAFDADRTGTVGGHRVAVLRNSVRHTIGSDSAGPFAQSTTGIRLQVRTCPTCGAFNVQVGKKVMTVKTRSATTGWKYVTLRWAAHAGWVDLDEVTPYPHPRVTSSYVRSWVLLRS